MPVTAVVRGALSAEGVSLIRARLFGVRRSNEEQQDAHDERCGCRHVPRPAFSGVLLYFVII